MSIVKTIKSLSTDDIIYPVTKADAVYMANSTVSTVESEINDIINGFYENMLGLGTAIPENSDLNDYKSIGIYNCPNSSVVGTLTNLPSSSSFKLIVTKSIPDNTIIKQIYIGNNEQPNIWIRRYHITNEVWGDWYRIGSSLVKTSTLTVASGFTGDSTYNWCRKNGNLIQFFIGITAGTLSNGWNTVATLPADYRPANYINFTGVDNATGGAIQSNVNTNGTIQIWKTSSGSSTANVRLHAVFIT